jgi:hypothetical protein
MVSTVPSIAHERAKANHHQTLPRVDIKAMNHAVEFSYRYSLHYRHSVG